MKIQKYCKSIIVMLNYIDIVAKTTKICYIKYVVWRLAILYIVNFSRTVLEKNHQGGINYE